MLPFQVLLTQFYLALVLDYVPGGSLMRFVDRKLLSEVQVRIQECILFSMVIVEQHFN